MKLLVMDSARSASHRIYLVSITKAVSFAMELQWVPLRYSRVQHIVAEINALVSFGSRARPRPRIRFSWDSWVLEFLRVPGHIA